jgi:hypothetical protein
MSRKQLLMVVLAIVMVGAAISALFAAAQQVTLCHKPQGNETNSQTITVSSAAAQTHFAHGDTAGACPVSPSR